MKTKSYFFILILWSVVISNSCKKQFDLPPVKQVNDGARITIASLKAKYNPYSVYKFKGDTNLYCVVIADEVSGNLYKDIFVQDATGGLHVKLVTSGGLFIGDSIRINLNNILLNAYSDLIQLDSVDTEKSIVKLASGLNPQPQEVNITDLTSNVTAFSKFQSRLIKLSSVEFLNGQQNQPYANAVTKAAIQYTLQDCARKQVTIRTSGYSFFANQNTPSGNGSIIGIASQFNKTVQLILRSPTEVNMSGALCQTLGTPVDTGKTYLLKNFEDGSIGSSAWLNINVVGAINWTVKTSTNISNPTKIAECNNYIGSGNQPACETWLISPSINLSASTLPTFSFSSASIFSGPPLQVLVSVNYSTGLPSTATWTTLPAIFGSSAVYASSGDINLSAYKKSNLRVAFKYTGNNASGQRWQIDNIRISE